MIRTLSAKRRKITVFLFTLAALVPLMTSATGGSDTGSDDKVISDMEMASKMEALENRFINLYASIQGQKPNYEVFKKALTGYYNLDLNNSLDKGKQVISIADFSLSANEKRLWIIDLKNKKTLFNTYVAHGRNTGNVFAKTFSNTVNSNMSSMGFYVTAETYYGKHGLSLRLDGQEKGINDNARRRAIVLHGADYVSEGFIKRVGRLGRSFGCPSVPMELHKDIINTIAGKTCLFIHYPDAEYEKGSSMYDYTNLLTSL